MKVSGPRGVGEGLTGTAAATLLASATTFGEIHLLTTSEATGAIDGGIRTKVVERVTAQMDYPSSYFDHVHSYTLASGMAANLVPGVLRECHRVLRPGGKLVLTFMDPSPVAGTEGPLLRAWLEEHVLLRLEMHFCTSNPTKLMPLWVAQAGMEAVQCAGAEQPLRAVVGTGGLGAGTAGVREELGVLCGQQLWRQTWGVFVEGAMWWEEGAIAEECARLGTVFEWRVLEAQKADLRAAASSWRA
jgi:SAM-dependent methyltransferase